MFKINYLSVYITDENIVASEFYKGIYIDKPIADIINTINIEWDSNRKIYEQKEIIITLLNYCVSRLDVKFMDSIVLFLIIPVEYESVIHEKAFEDALYKVNHISNVAFLENVLSAGVTFLQKTSTDYKRKFIIYSEKNKTYISLLWVNSKVDFVCIEKELTDVTKNDILNSINIISMRITRDIPNEFAAHPEIDKLRYSWKEPIENNVYVIAPDRMQYLWGEFIDEYKLVYIDYMDNIVLKGADIIIEIIKKKI